MTETNIPSAVSSAVSRWRWLKTLAVWIPALVAIGAAGFFYWQWQKAQEQIQHTSSGEAVEVSREEIDGVVEQLSKIVLLPEGETPTVSTVKDKDSLTENQEFFQEVENGDQVLVYQQAKKAFLYRPSTKKLINLAPINIASVDTNQAQPTVASASAEATADKAATDEPSPSTQEAELFTVELRNGTSQQGLTYDFEPKLLGAFEQVEIADRNNASRDNYEESMVIAVNLTNKAQAQQVANKLGLVFADLPTGEIGVEADVLIILGADQL